MEPVTALGVLSLVLNIMCAALNLIRGVHLAGHSLQVAFSSQFSVKDVCWGKLMGTRFIHKVIMHEVLKIQIQF